MDLTSLLIFLIVGGVAGFVAAKLMRGYGLGLLMNILVGIIGAFLGGFVFGLFGVAFAGIIGTFVTATIGAVLLLGIASLLTRRGAWT